MNLSGKRILITGAASGLGRAAAAALQKDAAARRIVRACAKGQVRDGGMTVRGWLTLMLARHAPRLTDRVAAARLLQLARNGMSIRLDAATQSSS